MDKCLEMDEISIHNIIKKLFNKMELLLLMTMVDKEFATIWLICVYAIYTIFIISLFSIFEIELETWKNKWLSLSILGHIVQKLLKLQRKS